MTPIVFSTDDNYVMPTAVAIRSIVANTDLGVIDFFILFKDSLSAKSKAILKRAVQWERKTVNLDFLNVASFVNRAESHIGHISGATYYRLALPDLLQRYDQCLYLDGDIIVAGDIKPLLEMSLADEYLVAGVKATGPIFYKSKDRKKILEELEIPDLDQYVNAGVLLMNLKGMRKENLANKMIQMIPKEYTVQDQDIINIVCYNKIYFLGPQYNAMPTIFEYPKAVLNKAYSLNDIREAKKTPRIIHFANKYKPWKYSDRPKGDIWYATYQNIFSDSLSRIALSRIERMHRWLNRVKNIVYSLFNGGCNGERKN